MTTLVKSRIPRRIGNRNPNLYSSGGTIGTATAQGALSGAAMGSAFGPWGAGIGAVVGGGAAYFGAKQNQDKQDAAQSEFDKLNNQQFTTRQSGIDTAQLNNYNMNINSRYQLRNGGKIQPRGLQGLGNGDAIATGATHEQGGIPLAGAEIEKGENVRPQADGTIDIDSAKLGTAQANRPLMLKKAELESQLQPLMQEKAKHFLTLGKRNSIHKANSAKRQSEILDTQIGELNTQIATLDQEMNANFEQQQAVNGDNNGQPVGQEQQLANGGTIPPYAEGQDYDRFNDPYSFQAGESNFDQLQRQNRGIYGTSPGMQNVNRALYGVNPQAPTAYNPANPQTGNQFKTGAPRNRNITSPVNQATIENPNAFDVNALSNANIDETSGVNQIVPGDRNRGNRMSPTTKAAVANAALGAGQMALNLYSNKQLHDRDVPQQRLLDFKPLQENTSNVQEQLLSKQKGDLLRAYQENPTPANYARYQQATARVNDQIAAARDTRFGRNLQVGNINTQTGQRVAAQNAQTEFANARLRYNEDTAFRNARTEALQGGLARGAESYNLYAAGKSQEIDRGRLRAINPYGAGYIERDAFNYKGSQGKELLTKDLTSAANALTGQKRKDAMEQLRKKSGLNSKEWSDLLTTNKIEI